jgi:hypothetical protein
VKSDEEQNDKLRSSTSQATFLRSLAKQLELVSELRVLAFDDPKYAKWCSETGEVLDKLFGPVDSHQHPCVTAFLNYKIPVNYSASRSQMQEYYRNILSYQADLLTAYLEDFEESLREWGNRTDLFKG